MNRFAEGAGDRTEPAGTGMTGSLPRWVHRDLPHAAPPDSWRSLRSARVPPVHYLDKPLRLNLGATSLNPGVQFLMSKGVQFRTSVDKKRRRVREVADQVVIPAMTQGALGRYRSREGWPHLSS